MLGNTPFRVERVKKTLEGTALRTRQTCPNAAGPGPRPSTQSNDLCASGVRLQPVCRQSIHGDPVKKRSAESQGPKNQPAANEKQRSPRVCHPRPRSSARSAAQAVWPRRRRVFEHGLALPRVVEAARLIRIQERMGAWAAADARSRIDARLALQPEGRPLPRGAARRGVQLP